MLTKEQFNKWMDRERIYENAEGYELKPNFDM